MALSKPVEGKIDISKFNCPICSETLKSPKILPCLHTFCEQCIHEFILSMGRKTEQKISEFNCPVCRTVVKPLNGHEEIAKWSAKLNNNVLIATIIEISKGDSQQECHACKRHEQKNEAKFWCKECDEAFCEKCNSMHNWMKLLCTHDMVPIKDLGSETMGFDLKAIVENCTKHPSKMIEAFCFEHNELCCLVCLTSDHRGCENVKAIEQILDYATFDEKYHQSLVEMKAAAHTFLNSKEKQAEATRFAVEILEEEAAKFVEQLKCKIDSLFESFTKQIHIFRDEQRTKMNVRIRLVTQFIQSLEHWINVTKVVKESESQSKLFIHMETVKQQLAASVNELVRTTENDTSVNVRFVKNSIIVLAEADEIGHFQIEEESLVGQLSDILTLCRNLGIKRFPTLEEINVCHMTSFRIPGSVLTCGVSIDAKHMIVGDATSSGNKLHSLNKITGSVLNTITCTGSVKRLCYDSEQKYVFISCYGRQLYKAIRTEEGIQALVKLSFNKDYVGALCKYGDEVVVVTDQAIKKFAAAENPTSSKEMKICFETNTKSRSLNGMYIKDEQIFYTTADKEIKCAMLSGENIFCYKNENIKTPDCIAVLHSGMTFIADSNFSSLHVLSAKGKQHRTLLVKFEKISKPKDIWLDVNETILYIVGQEYIEMYRIQGNWK